MEDGVLEELGDLGKNSLLSKDLQSIKGNLTRLRGLWLYSNKLTVLEDGVFEGLGLTLKEPGGGGLDIFCYISAGCYFFALKLLDFFPSSLALDLRPFL